MRRKVPIFNIRSLVSDYQKDKRELFDLVEEFKSNKKLSETRLLNEKQRHELGTAKLLEVVDKLNTLINDLEALIREMQEDLQEFDLFSQTEVFSKLNPET